MAKWSRERIIRETLRRESALLSLALGGSRESTLPFIDRSEDPEQRVEAFEEATRHHS